MRFKQTKKTLKIIYLYSVATIKSYLMSPTGVILFTLGKLLRFLMFFILIYFIVSKTDSLKGYSVSQAIIFFLTFNIIDTIAQFLFREVYRFRGLIVSGDFNQILTKPIHPFSKILFGGVDILDFFMLLFYVPITLYYFITTNQFSLINIILYFGLIINAVLLATAFHIFVLGFAILTTEIDHAIMIYRDLTSTGRFPIEIYPNLIKNVFTFVIPVAIMMNFPAKALFGILSLPNIIIAFTISFVFLYLSSRFWHLALKKYQSWGG